MRLFLFCFLCRGDIDLGNTKCDFWFEVKECEDDIAFKGCCFEVVFEQVSIDYKGYTCFARFVGALLSNVVICFVVYLGGFLNFCF